MKFKQLFLCVLLFAATMNAQTIVKGDMNDDGTVDVSDVTMTVSTILGNTPLQTINLANNPYEADNSAVVGTWWKTKNESITFDEDGTTDLEGADTYAYQPFLGRIVFYNSGVPVTLWTVVDVSAEAIYVNPAGTASIRIYTKTVPVQRVTGIVLSTTSVTLAPNDVLQLTATVSPTDADNPNVLWSSSNESVTTVSSTGLVTAVAAGTAAITCSASDGSGVTAECEVAVFFDNSGSIGGRNYVDLGLPSGTLWATCNIGATNPEDYGDYFAWGEVEPQEDNAYTWTSYKYAVDSYTTLTKYCNKSSYGNNGFTDTLTELKLIDDAAYMNWGSNWRMPSKEQFDELINSSYTTTEWITQNGVNGRKITSKSNGNSIFLPAAGARPISFDDAGSWGIYWSRTLSTVLPNAAWGPYFDSSDMRTDGSGRNFGRSVRPVRLSE